jgi:hypothetical protein
MRRILQQRRPVGLRECPGKGERVGVDECTVQGSPLVAHAMTVNRCTYVLIEASRLFLLECCYVAGYKTAEQTLY